MTGDELNDVTRALAAFGGPSIQYHSFGQPAFSATAAVPALDPDPPKLQPGPPPSEAGQLACPFGRTPPAASRTWPAPSARAKGQPVATPTPSSAALPPPIAPAWTAASPAPADTGTRVAAPAPPASRPLTEVFRLLAERPD